MKQELEPLLLLIVKLKKERRVKEKKNLENWNLEKSLVNYTYPITTLPSYKHFNYSLKKGPFFRSYPGLYREIEEEFDGINLDRFYHRRFTESSSRIILILH